MILKSPFMITSGLMAGVQVGGATISLGYGYYNSERRMVYSCFIDLPDGTEYEIADLCSGCHGGSLQEGFASLLGFLSAAGESFRYAGMKGENSTLFPAPVTEWASENAEDIAMLGLEIEETEDLIEE